MPKYKIEGNIAVVIKNNTISKVNLKPDRKYISPDNKYAICIAKNKQKAKLLPLNEKKISAEIDGSLANNNLLQNIALQELSAIFYLKIKNKNQEENKNEKYKIVGFEYPSSL